MQEQSAGQNGDASTIDRSGANVTLTYKEAEQLCGVGARTISNAARKGTLSEVVVMRGGRKQKGATLAQLAATYPQMVASVATAYADYLSSTGVDPIEINERLAGFHVLMETYKRSAVDEQTLALSMMTPIEEKHALEMQLERERTAHEHAARLLLQRSLDDMRTMLRVENAQLIAATSSTSRRVEEPEQRTPFEWLQNRSTLSMIAGGVAGVAVVILVATMVASITLSISGRWFTDQIEAMERTTPGDAPQELMWSNPARFELANLRRLKNDVEAGRLELGEEHALAVRMKMASFMPPLVTRIVDIDEVLRDGSVEEGGDALRLRRDALQKLAGELDDITKSEDEAALDQRQLRQCITWIERMLELE